MKKSNANSKKGVGVCTHFESRDAGWKIENLLPLMLELGVTHVRQEIKWEWVEKEKGIYEIPGDSLHWLDAVTEAGLGVILILDYGNSLYENPLDADGFAGYAGFMAARLRTYPILAFEIWNEPTNFFFLKQYGGSWSGKGESLWLDKFCELVAKASAAIKSAAPETVVIANPGEPQFFHMALKHPESLEDLDGVSHHPYCVRFPPETLPLGGGEISAEDGVVCADDSHSFLSLFEHTVSHGEKHLGKRLHLFATEFGFSTYNANARPGWFSGYSELTQACYLTRAVILCFAAGVQSPCIYDLMNDGISRENTEHHFGLIRNEIEGYERKPSFFAIKRLISHLGTDWDYVEQAPVQIDVPKGVFAKGLVWQKIADEPFLKIEGPQLFWFKTPGKHIAIVWKAGRSDGESNPPLGRILWDHAPRISRVTLEDLVTGELLPSSIEPPPPSGQYSKRFILQDVPFRASPILITFETE